VQDWDVPPAKIAVLPNGVDERFFAAGELDRTNGGKPPHGEGAVIVFVGSFQPWHGLGLVLDSFSKVRLECPGTTLLLIGDGPVRPEVEKKVECLGLTGSVRFAGQQPHASIPGWLQSADIAIAPYQRLTDELWFSPLKLYEYMAAGKAVVATDSGQIAQVIESGVTGVLVEPNNAEALAAALIDLVNDPEKRDLLGRNASRKARSEHTWGAVIRNLEQIYRELKKNDENI
jgi:glycosyltransferase involved in cell wall biosynthesis